MDAATVAREALSPFLIKKKERKKPSKSSVLILNFLFSAIKKNQKIKTVKISNANKEIYTFVLLISLFNCIHLVTLHKLQKFNQMNNFTITNDCTPPLETLTDPKEANKPTLKTVYGIQFSQLEVGLYLWNKIDIMKLNKPEFYLDGQFNVKDTSEIKCRFLIPIHAKAIIYIAN